MDVAALAKEGEIDSTLTTLVKETQRVKQYALRHPSMNGHASTC